MTRSASTQLALAIECGSLRDIRQALAAGGDPNKQFCFVYTDRNGQQRVEIHPVTCLSFAVKHGLRRVAMALIDCKADLHKKVPRNRQVLTGLPKSALETAVYYNQCSTLRVLLKAKCDPNERGATYSPVMMAAYFGFDAVLKTLLQFGAYVHPLGDTVSPLCEAVRNGHEKCCSVCEPPTFPRTAQLCLGHTSMKQSLAYQSICLVEDAQEDDPAQRLRGKWGQLPVEERVVSDSEDSSEEGA